MRTWFVSALLWASASAVLLAACNGNVTPAASPVPSARMQSISELQLPPLAPTASSCSPSGACLMFVSAPKQNDVEEYSITGSGATRTGAIKSGLVEPLAMAADKKNLLVVNGFDFNVLEFSTAGTPKLIRTLNDPAGDPEDVAAASDGNIYVTNVSDSGGDGEILMYKPRGKKATRIGDNNLTEAFFIAVKPDDSEICVDGIGRGSGPAEVDCTTNGGTSWSNTGISIGFPGGLAFDTQGNLVVDDQAGLITDEGTGASIACPGHDCVGIAFGPNDTHIYTVDASSGTAYQIEWPSGKVDFGVSRRKQGAMFAQPIPGA